MLWFFSSLNAIVLLHSLVSEEVDFHSDEKSATFSEKCALRMNCIDIVTHQLVILSMISALFESAYTSIKLSLLSVCAVGYAEKAFRSFWVVSVLLRAKALYSI